MQAELGKHPNVIKGRRVFLKVEHNSIKYNVDGFQSPILKAFDLSLILFGLFGLHKIFLGVLYFK